MQRFYTYSTKHGSILLYVEVLYILYKTQFNLAFCFTSIRLYCTTLHVHLPTGTTLYTCLPLRAECPTMHRMMFTFQSMLKHVLSSVFCMNLKINILFQHDVNTNYQSLEKVESLTKVQLMPVPEVRGQVYIVISFLQQ